MKRNIKLLLAFAVAAASLSVVSCNKEEASLKVFYASLEQYCDQNGKTILQDNNLLWQTGDQIVIFGSAGSAIYAANGNGATTSFSNVSGDPGDGGYTAFYPSTLSTDGIHVVLPAVQESESGELTGFPMYSTNPGTGLDFKNLCSILKIHMATDRIISSITIEAPNVCGTFTVDNSGAAPALVCESGSGSVTLTCNHGVVCSEGRDCYIYLPPATYTAYNFKITIMASGGTSVTKTLNNDITLERNKLYNVEFSELTFLPEVPEGALCGLFSVSATQQVWCSQGNLQFNAYGSSLDGSDNVVGGTWRFAEHQYDIIGSANSNVSSSYNGWIDLFGWGTSGWNSGAVCYQPYSTSNVATDYQPGGTAGQSISGGTNMEADWAYHNAIANGGNTSHLWRTLSLTSCAYLVGMRPNAAERYGTGSIAGVRGLFILPDEWATPEGCTFTPGGATNAAERWTLNTFTAQQWALMEAAGAAFLPVTGTRTGTVWTDGVTVNGCYWTSTYISSSNYLYAYVLQTLSSMGIQFEGPSYNQAYAVRPVQYYNVAE